MAESPRIEELKRRVQSDPASIAFAALAEEYRRAGRFQEAIETCTAGLVRHPSYLSAHVTLGRALIDVGRLPDAKRELEAVLKLAPENLAAIRGLAEIHERLRDETHQHDRADESVASEPTDSEMMVAEIQAASGFARPPIDEPASPETREPSPPASQVESASEAPSAKPPLIRFRDSTPAAAAPPMAQDAPVPWELPPAPAPEQPPAPEVPVRQAPVPARVHAPGQPAVRTHDQPPGREPAATFAREQPMPVVMPASAEMPLSVQVPTPAQMPVVVTQPPHDHLEVTADPALAGLEQFLNAIRRARGERAAVR